MPKTAYKTKTKQKSKSHKNEVVLDAKDRILGRLATEIAMHLQGKNKPNYKSNMDDDLIVRVLNIKQIRVTGKKLTDKIYYHYSGYPGGMRARSYEEIFNKNPKLVLQMAVRGMLPKNRLKKTRMKRLIIEL